MYSVSTFNVYTCTCTCSIIIIVIILWCELNRFIFNNLKKDTVIIIITFIIKCCTFGMSLWKTFTNT